MLRVLSLGAGVQSSAVLVAAANGDLPGLDVAVFSDTGDEPEAVYRWLRDVLRPIADDAGITLIEATHDSDMTLGQRTLDPDARGFLGIPAHTLNDDGARAMARRSCTWEAKIVPLRQTVRSQMRRRRMKVKQHAVRMSIGISIDEAHRMRDSGVSYIDNHYPLIDAGWSRDDCRSYVEDKTGLTPPRSACIFCPYHSAGEWEEMMVEDPASFQQAVEFDEQLRMSAERNDRSSYGQLFLHGRRLPLVEAVKAGGPVEGGQGNECYGVCWV